MEARVLRSMDRAGYGSVGNDVPVGQGQQYYNTELEQKTFDPDKAKWHLKEAGMDSLEVSLSAADAAFAGAVDAGILFQASAKESAERAAAAELDSTKREAMYFEIQDIVSNQGGVIIPMFANYVFGTSNAIGTPEKMASNWDMDGERWAERWWFA